MFTGSVWRRGLANGQLQPEADQPAEHPQGPEHRPQEPGGQLQRCDNGKSRGPGPDTGAGTIYSIHHAPDDDDLSSANDTVIPARPAVAEIAPIQDWSLIQISSFVRFVRTGRPRTR